MRCVEFEARLHPYVDGELSVDETADAEAHLGLCPGCSTLVRHEREFRLLLRRQPREAAPAALRTRILARNRAELRRRLVRPWLVATVTSAAAAALVLALFWPSTRPAPLLAELVDKHLAFAQVERPAERAATDPADLAQWFRERAGLRVPVPDFSPAGIHLVGGRLADARQRRVAYLLYEKGMTLLSVFMVPAGDGELSPTGRPVSYRGHEYLASETKGQRVITWTDGHALFGLVSMLDWDALLECGDRLRAERASQTRL